MSARTSADAASVIVVGAGAFGSAAADALARRGWAVTVVEQYAPANARGSSGDLTRQLRRGHGAGSLEEDLWYIRSADRGIALWQELSDSWCPGLIEPTGMVWLAREEAGEEQRTHERLDLAGVANELLTPAQTQARFPGIAVDDLAFAVCEPGAAVIRAQQAVLALLGRATSFGARLLPGQARPSGPGAVTLTDGSRHGADRVVWACGAWLGQLFPRDAPVRASWQDVIHWQTPPGWVHTPSSAHVPMPTATGCSAEVLATASSTLPPSASCSPTPSRRNVRRPACSRHGPRAARPELTGR